VLAVVDHSLHIYPGLLLPSFCTGESRLPPKTENGITV